MRSNAHPCGVSPTYHDCLRYIRDILIDAAKSLIRLCLVPGLPAGEWLWTRLSGQSVETCVNTDLDSDSPRRSALGAARGGQGGG